MDHVKSLVKFVKRRWPALLIALLLFCLLGTVGFRWLLRHRVETSPFLLWCQNVTPEGIAGVSISDSFHREVFTENYILSAAEIRVLTEILNGIDADDLELIPYGEAPNYSTSAFNLYVRLDEDNEHSCLFRGFAATEPLLYISDGSPYLAANGIGEHQRMVLDCQAVYDFVKARADGPWPDVTE